MTSKEEFSTTLTIEEEIDIGEIFHALFKGKFLILAISSFFAISAVIYSLTLPNIYTATTLLKPTDSDNSSITNSLGGYAGIASLAGINLASGGETNIQAAIEKLKTYKFFEESLLPNINLENLMAVKSWDRDTNTLSYKANIFNPLTNEWTRKKSPPRGKIPSSQEAYKEFHDHFFSISEDKKTGFITLAVDHQSPYEAKKWLDLVVLKINSVSREEQKEETTRSIEFLRKQISATNFPEIKQVLAFTLQKETEKLMMIEVNEDFVFQSLDPPIASEVKSKPSRALIAILGTIIGGMLGILIILIRFYQSR